MKQRISGSLAVINSLLEEDTDTIFGYPGGAIMPVYDALYDYTDKLKHILVRHEQGAVFAAEGYAKSTGKTGVCFATSGPGATNLITGLASANVDSIPLVCITGQVPAGLLGLDSFQETHVIGVSLPVTKWAMQVTEAKDIPSIIARAFFLASSGRPGPVLIEITKDAQLKKLDYRYEKCLSVDHYIPRPKVSHHKIIEAAKLINNSQRPLIIYGHGVLISGAKKELKELIEKTGIPAASTLLGLSAIPYSHPLHKGMVGMHGHYAPNMKTNECDLLIAIGMRFDDRVTSNTEKYAKQANIIHIDIDESEIDKNIPTDVSIVGDAREVLSKLIPRLRKNEHPEWLLEFFTDEKIEKEKINLRKSKSSPENILMDEVVDLVSDKTKGKAIIVTDVGQHQMVAARNYKFSNGSKFISSGGSGAMGFGLPAAIGAKTGRPDKQVVVFCGDGGFQMSLQELGTIMQEKIDVKIVIMNNNYLGMVRQWQELFFDKRYSFTEMISPNIVKLADSYGLKAKTVSNSLDLKSAVTEMLDNKGTYILEVKIKKKDNVFPIIPGGASVSEMTLE